MNRLERLKQIAKEHPDFGKKVGLKMYVIDEFNQERDRVSRQPDIVENKMVNLKKELELETVRAASTETLLQELKDRGVIRSWYYNGTYHVGNELPK